MHPLIRRSHDPFASAIDLYKVPTRAPDAPWLEAPRAEGPAGEEARPAPFHEAPLDPRDEPAAVTGPWAEASDLLRRAARRGP